MPIGTAQPTSEQLRAAEHHFIASHDLDAELNCGTYETQALACLEELFARHDRVIAVGGSGLYVKALCEGMDDLPQADGALRGELARRLRDEGVEAPRGAAADARSRTLRHDGPPQSGPRAAGAGGVPRYRTPLLLAPDRSAAGAAVRHREDRHRHAPATCFTSGSTGASMP